MALLTGDLQAQVFAAFKGKLLKGLIRQNVVGLSAGVDARGDAIDVAPVDTPIEGFTENFSDYIRATAGIPDSDVQINIFAGSCPGIVPTVDNLVMLKQKVGLAIVDQWYQLRGPIKTDPATALWGCRGYPIQAPD